MFRKLLAATLAMIAMATTTPALADPITLGEDDIGTTFSFDFDGYTDGDDTIEGLTSQISFTLLGISDDGQTYNFGYDAENTSTTSTGTLTGFAFDVDPDITGVDASGTFDFAQLDGRYPNQIGQVDVCFKAKNGGSCAGAGSGKDGLQNGQSGSGAFALYFANPNPAITLSDFFVRYQGVNGDGSASGKVTTSSSSTGGTQVPEPGMLGLFGLALCGIGVMRRRRRAIAA